jgi:hypothetical protein
MLSETLEIKFRLSNILLDYILHHLLTHSIDASRKFDRVLSTEG